MGRIGPTELVIILCIVILIFGANRIPQLAKSLGEGIKEFRKSVKTATKDEDDSAKPSDKA
ncbi:MAG TPA: twin-arginine translocase TatA/TatE family subunit [bacterium]|nr:twin-arginine translocase TatA/TatE family subunit [bacterium]